MTLAVAEGRKMNVAVVGSGALGLYYGALLQRGGHDVTFLMRRDYDAVKAGGLKVTSPTGDFNLPQVKACRTTAEIGPVDMVLVGLKATANAKLEPLVRPLVADDTVVVTLQNGLGCEDLLAEAFGADRVIGGTAFLCSNRGEPGVVHHLDQGSVRLAEFRGGLTGRLASLAKTFSAAGIPCEACPDLARIRWEKLVWNIPFNGLCALTGLATDKLLACDETRRLIIQMMREVIDAANCQGLSESIDADAFMNRMITATEGMDAYKPSMMIDRLSGQPLELGAIYAEPLRRAEAAGEPMTRVGVLYALLQVTE